MKESTQQASDLSEADFMATFLERHRPPQEAVDHFTSIEWTCRLLQDPVYKVIPTFSRHLKTSGEDFFFSRTVNTETTIPHMIALQLKDFKTLDATPGLPYNDPSEKPNPKLISPAPEKPDVLILLQIGKGGLDGHPSVIHGGMTCALLDEMMGLLIMLHHNNLQGQGSRDSLFTANLNVNYRSPVPTPSALLIKCWLTKREGRKWVSKGQITDQHGQVLVDAEGLWITAKRASL